MDLTAAVVNFLVGALGAGFVGAILKVWLDHKLSVQRGELGEERELRRKKRESSTAVVEILTEWVRFLYKDPITGDDLWRLQATYWKNIMWLDADLVKALTPLLVWREDAPTSGEVIIQARKTLLGLSKPDLTEDDLVKWAIGEVHKQNGNHHRPSVSRIVATTDTGDPGMTIKPDSGNGLTS
jgi:hypothetical protein